MLTRLYVEALQIDEELADQVCEAWDSARGLPGVGPDSWTVLVIYIASLFAFCQLR